MIHDSPHAPVDVFKLTTTPLLLVLDEAQHLGEDKEVTEQHRDEVRILLKRIHTGGVDHPLILLAGGLGMTSRAFASLGISRKALRCLIEMKTLDKESEHAVIRDWLVKDGKIKEDPDMWIDSISRETYEWPQHLWIYTDAAVRQLKKSDGQMTAEALELALKEGREGKRQYCKGRTDELEDSTFDGLAELFQGASLERGFKKERIVQAVGERGFEQALAKGILYRTENRSYSISSPRDYMVGVWMEEQEQTARKRQEK